MRIDYLISLPFKIHFGSLNYILLYFSKCLCLSIWSSSMLINFHLLPLILVFSAVGVYLATASSSDVNSSSSTSASSSSGYFPFLFLPINPNIYWEKLYYYCSLFSSFLSRWLRLFFRVEFSFSLRWFCLSRPVGFLFLVLSMFELSRLALSLCWTRKHTVLIGWFKLPTDSPVFLSFFWSLQHYPWFQIFDHIYNASGTNVHYVSYILHQNFQARLEVWWKLIMRYSEE